MAVGDGAGTVHLIDTASGETIGEPVAAHAGDDIWELVLGPGGDVLVSASTDNTVKTWRVEQDGS